MKSLRTKILDIKSLKVILDNLRKSGKKIVFTNGCFDLVHIGHIRYFEAAREKGDILVVGVNTDESVRNIKGKGRPMLKIGERKKILASFECIDFVTEFSEPTPERIIRELRPDVLVKGEDYALDEIVGRNLVENYGGSVQRIPYVKGYSTSSIINKIRQVENES